MSDITRSEAIKTLKEHLSHWERLLQEHICEEQEGIDTISALKLAIASLETDEAYQLEYERTTKNDLVHCQHIDKEIAKSFIEDVEAVKDLLPSVTPQEPRCKECKWWKDSDGEYRRGVGAESQCPINRKEVYEGNGYCFMFEPQESEDKE